MNILVLNANSLINEDRRRKFSAAVIGGGFLAACVSEIWLHSNISDKELFLETYELYRADRPSREENISTHGGSLIAVSKSFSSAKIEHNLPQCCVAVEVTINNDKLIICAFYSPPKESVYRYTVSDFELMLTLSTRFQKNQILFCGDINFPQTNWNTFHSEDDFEREVLDLFDKHCLQQAVTIPTCGKNTLDIALHRNLSILCEENHIVEKLYNISNHTPVALKIEMPIYTQQTAIKTAYSFNAADYDEILKIMENSPFEPTCYSNIDNMVNEFYVYPNDIIEKCVPDERLTDKRYQVGSPRRPLTC